MLSADALGRATCLLVGGPMDGASCSDVPMLVPGLAPEYWDIGLGADGEAEPRAMYRRVGPHAVAHGGFGTVSHYEYDEDPVVGFGDDASLL